MKYFGGCLGLLFLIVGIGALIAWVFMLLWNNIAPLFWNSAPILTFWQAWGCTILLDIIGFFLKGGKSSD